MNTAFATMSSERDPGSGDGSGPENPIVGHPMPDGETGDDRASVPGDED